MEFDVHFEERHDAQIGADGVLVRGEVRLGDGLRCRLAILREHLVDQALILDRLVEIPEIALAFLSKST